MSDMSIAEDGRLHRALYPLLVPFVSAFIVAALGTDLAYWATLNPQWLTFSVWLLTFALLAALPTAAAGLIDLTHLRQVRTTAPRATTVGAHVLALLLTLLDVFVHSRDGYTAVVPEGLILSAAAVLVLVVSQLGRHPRTLPRLDAQGRVRRRTDLPALLACLLIAVLAAGSLLVLSGPRGQVVAVADQTGGNPVLPPPHQYLLPPMDIAPVAHWGASNPTAAPGLAVAAFATGLVHPRMVSVLPNGDVLVVESSGPAAPVNRPKDLVVGWVQGIAGAKQKAPDRILLFRAGAAGASPQRFTFIDHLASPFGVALVGSTLYVADTDALLKFPYAAGQTSIATKGTVVTPLPGGPIDHHWTKTLVASRDGASLFVGIGSNSNITENGIGAELGRADIWQVDAATGAHRIYASGIRNPTGLGLEPATGQLWAIANERDEIGPSLVPDYLTSVKDGGFYGWPYSYYGQHVDPRVRPQRPDLVATALPPDYALSSHAAPLGLAFATGQLPAPFNAGAFVGEHGSWDRTPLNGYKVVFVPFANGRPDGKPIDVLTGFLTQGNRARGRPVGIATDASGALLVADDLGGVVWRVTPAAAPAH